MDKQRAVKWLTDTVEIAHDLKGIEVRSLSTLIEMPEDIADALIECEAIRMSHTNATVCYFDAPNDCIVKIKIRPTWKDSSKLKITILV